MNDLDRMEKTILDLREEIVELKQRLLRVELTRTVFVPYIPPYQPYVPYEPYVRPRPYDIWYTTSSTGDTEIK